MYTLHTVCTYTLYTMQCILYYTAVYCILFIVYYKVTAYTIQCIQFHCILYTIQCAQCIHFHCILYSGHHHWSVIIHNSRCYFDDGQTTYFSLSGLVTQNDPTFEILRKWWKSCSGPRISWSQRKTIWCTPLRYLCHHHHYCHHCHHCCHRRRRHHHCHCHHRHDHHHCHCH